MISADFFQKDEKECGDIYFAAVCARFKGKWIFCRGREHDLWEIPAGRIKGGETPREAADRILRKKTGAADYRLSEVCLTEVSGGEAVRTGEIFFAEVLGDELPAPEKGDLRISGFIPEEISYSGIQPYVFERVQGWLNYQTNPDELWDLYDENRNLLQRNRHRRSDPIKKGQYHLAVLAIVRDPSDGGYLLTRRTPNKGFPNMWEFTGGAVLSGEDSFDAALREVREETGVTAEKEDGHFILTIRTYDTITDVFIFEKEFDAKDIVLQEGETCGAVKADKERIKDMCVRETIVPYPDMDKILEKMK